MVEPLTPEHPQDVDRVIDNHAGREGLPQVHHPLRGRHAPDRPRQQHAPVCLRFFFVTREPRFE